MKQIELSQLEYYSGARVIVPGWIHAVREQKKRSFLTLRDGWCTGRVVVEDERLRTRLSAIPSGAAVQILGTVQPVPGIAGGQELMAEGIRYEGGGAAQHPIDISKPQAPDLQLSTELDHRAHSLRRPATRFIHRLSALTLKLFREYLDAEGFTEIHAPKLNRGSAEGGANVFRMDYFGQEAFLAQSPQLHKQMMVGVFQKVYETGPVFRAEPHASARHLNEYISLDAEMGFIDSHRDIMALISRLLEFMAKQSHERSMDWPERFALPWTGVPEEIPVLHYRSIPDVLGGDEPEDLSPEDERRIGSWALENHGSEFVFVEGFPMSARPFYTMEDPDLPGYSRSFDLLFRGREIITGGQRLHETEAYLKALSARDMDPGEFVGYLEAFDAGMPPHGGFGLGLERWIQTLAGLDNIRQASLFPRDIKRLSP